MANNAFSSKVGLIMAAAGSAVGLGNIWKFPYVAGENGGGAFLLVYLACVVALGLPMVATEFLIGQRSRHSAFGAFRQLNGNNRWQWLSWMSLTTSVLIMGFYFVVTGWCFTYLAEAVVNTFHAMSTDQLTAHFNGFIHSDLRMMLFSLVPIVLTAAVLWFDVNKGIEQLSKILMPLLLLLLIVIVAAACMLPGAIKGIRFLLLPDFTKVSSSVLLEALGQAFFSLSLGTACLCTYASYFSRQTNLLRSATQIALLDTIIAILAGLMIFPAAFSVGINPDSGPSLIFITLPNVFQQAFAQLPVAGYIIGILFYALLVFAALTSTISMHEIGTAFFHEELHMNRRKAAWIITFVCSLIAVCCSLSVGAVSSIQLFGMPLMEFCDFLTAQVLLPAGAFLTSIMIGWLISRQTLRNEFTNGNTVSQSFFSLWHFCVRYVVPLCILLIFLHQFGVI